MRSFIRFVIGTGLLYKAIEYQHTGEPLGSLLFCALVALIFFRD